MTDLFLAHDNPAVCALIKAALKEVLELNLVSETNTGAETLQALSQGPSSRGRMLVIRYALSGLNGFDFIASAMRVHAPDVYIIPVLEGTESGEDWQKILQLGMRDAIVGPLPVNEMVRFLKNAVRSAQSHYEAFSGQYLRGSYVISVVSARGVQGKTVTATNLAAAMVAWTDRVLLLDLTLRPIDLALFLDDKCPHNISGAMQCEGEFLKNYFYKHPRLGFHYLVSPNEEKDIEAFDYNLVSDFLKKTGGLIDYTILDTGAPKSGASLVAIDKSDVILVVTTKDIISLLVTKDYIKFLRSDRQIAQSKIKLIINQGEVGAEISDAEVESLLELPITASIPSDPQAVTFSINSGAPIVIQAPSHPVSAMLRKLAEICYNRWDGSGGGPPGHGPNDPNKGWRHGPGRSCSEGWTYSYSFSRRISAHTGGVKS